MSASISTPVWPVVFTVAMIRMPGSVASGSNSTATLVMGNGWHRGIRSAVRLAAMMPARRATPKTSPFLARPSVMISKVSGCILIQAAACAIRSVTALSETSTICASPLPSKWVSAIIGHRQRRSGLRKGCAWLSPRRFDASGFHQSRTCARRTLPYRTSRRAC